MAISDDLAREAFLYGYSIDRAYTFLHGTTIAPGLPFNEFQLLRDLADDTYTAHPTINNDTLHLQGWFDVAAEPVVVTVPDADEGRYWILHTMDLGHYTTAMIGSRTRGPRGGRFLFASGDWAGTVPDDVDEVVRSDSNLIKVMGRIMTTGGPDLWTARGLQDAWRVRTLSQEVGTAGPTPVVRHLPDPGRTTWPERVNAVLADGTMARADARWLARFADVGLGPGRTDLTDDQLEAAERGRELGLRRLEELAPTVTSSGGILGTRAELQDAPREQFAEGTYLGQWGLPAVESVYRKVETGSDGRPLNGADGKVYRARFLPPDVSEFWSFTAYGTDDHLMAPNALNRHSRGDRTLTPDADGRYTLVLGADTAAHADDPSFLPIPEKDTYLVLRLYGPSQQIQDGGYAMPRFDVVDGHETGRVPAS